MYFKYCCNCKTKECQYKSTELLINKFMEKGYEFAGCPDKENAQEAHNLLMKINPNRKNIFKKMVLTVPQILG